MSYSASMFENVPRILDVENLLQLVRALGVCVEWEGETLALDASGLSGQELPSQLVKKLRGSVLLLGALAPLLDTISCALPGGCPIG